MPLIIGILDFMEQTKNANKLLVWNEELIKTELYMSTVLGGLPFIYINLHGFCTVKVTLEITLKNELLNLHPNENHSFSFIF